MYRITRHLFVSACIAAAALALLPLSTAAQVPRLIDFQGRLASPDTGKPMPDGEYMVTFWIYDRPEGGDLLWFEEQPVQLKGGVFNATLGATVPLTLDFDKPYWMAVSLYDQQQMEPRIRLTSAPYSLNAATVDGFHASDIPTPNYLLPLNGNGKFPADVWDVPMTLSCYTSEQPSWTLCSINEGYGDGLRGESRWVGVRGVSERRAGVQGESQEIGVKGMGAVGVYGDDSLSLIEMGVGVWGFSQVGVAGRFESPNGTALEVLGPSRFDGIAEVNGRLDVYGKGDGPAVMVDGPSVLNGYTDIGGVVIVDPPCEIPFWVNDWSWFRGYANFEGGHGPHNNLRVESEEGMDALTVLGKSTFHNRVTVAGGGVDVTGPSVIDGVLWIAGESFTPFDCRGWAHFGDSVAIDGGVSAMTGAWFGGLLNANGGAAVTGTLGVDGPCFFDGIVEIDSDCRTEFLCRGWSHFESDIVVDGALHVGGGILDMADLEVDGRCEIMNGLAVNNGSTLMGPTIIDDIVRIDRNCWTQFDCLGWAHFADGMAIDGTLGVAQFLWVGQGLTVEGDATVRQDLLVEGDLEVLGNKNAVVDTSVGMRKVYAQESPECWFEDFGQGRLDGGRATVEFDSLFLDTVTIDSDHPFMVFITPTGPMGDYYIEKSGASFIVVAENASAGATFDWRVVAKRRGYENDRLEPAKGVRAK